MAWRTVEHACGHTEDYQFYGKGIDRDRKQKWMATNDCTACKKETEAQRRELEKAENLKMIKSSGFDISYPDLVGSTKQIAWAVELRAKFVAAILSNIGQSTYTNEQIETLKQYTRDIVSDQVDSRYWIDSRDKSLTSIIGDHINKKK